MSHPAQLIRSLLSALSLASFLGLASSCTPSPQETASPTVVPATTPAPAPAAAPTTEAPPAEAPKAEAQEAAEDPSEAAPAAADASATSKDGYVKCPERRSNMCTKIYLPVCADVDTGIRCVRAPCPSIEQKTYASDCTACADTKVIGHRPGKCEAMAPAEATPGSQKTSSQKTSVPGAVSE